MDGSRDVHKPNWVDHLHLLKTSRESCKMQDLRQQATSGKREVSTLRKRVKQPETYLVMLFLVLVFAVIDSCRKPANQITARLYIGGVYLYEAFGHPVLKDRVQCRYEPTCSEYSIQAVRRHGIIPGVALTLKRVNSCRKSVPIGMPDPVPPLPLMTRGE